MNCYWNTADFYFFTTATDSDSDFGLPTTKKSSRPNIVSYNDHNNLIDYTYLISIMYIMHKSIKTSKVIALLSSCVTSYLFHVHRSHFYVKKSLRFTSTAMTNDGLQNKMTLKNSKKGKEFVI
jgi:uncharacterized membrane protein